MLRSVVVNVRAGLLRATQRRRGLIRAPLACAILVCRYFRVLREKENFQLFHFVLPLKMVHFTRRSPTKCYLGCL